MVLHGFGRQIAIGCKCDRGRQGKQHRCQKWLRHRNVSILSWLSFVRCEASWRRFPIAYYRTEPSRTCRGVYEVPFAFVSPGDAIHCEVFSDPLIVRMKMGELPTPVPLG